MIKRLLTKTKLEELRKELEELLAKRKEIIERIKESKEYGDLSENSEYLEAKEAWAFNEGRIQEIEDIFKHAELIDKKSNRKSNKETEVMVGTTVRLRLNRKIQEFHIVDPQEADPLEKKISIESPIVNALLGKKVGDEVSISTPKGVVKYKILAIK